MINEFWKNWKNKTKIEIAAINSVKDALNFLIINFPKEKIVSVYVKGSFVTREMRENSDVDIIPIVKDNKTLKKLRALRDKNKEMLKPSEFLPLSLTELKNKKSEPHSRRNVFLRDLEDYKLFYGKKLKNSDFPNKKFNELFLDELRILKNKSVPLHKKGKFGFQQLIKQVFWISYSEQKMLGKNAPRTWKELDNFIEDKNHIIHRAFYFRKNPTKNKQKREKFVRDLENYLDNLEKRFLK